MELFANLTLHCLITYLDSIKFSDILVKQFSLNCGLKFIYDAFHMTATDSHVYVKSVHGTNLLQINRFELAIF